MPVNCYKLSWKEGAQAKPAHLQLTSPAPMALSCPVKVIPCSQSPTFSKSSVTSCLWGWEGHSYSNHDTGCIHTSVDTFSSACLYHKRHLHAHSHNQDPEHFHHHKCCLASLFLILELQATPSINSHPLYFSLRLLLSLLCFVHSIA